MWKLTDNVKVPIYTWADPETLDDGSIRQIRNLANLPFAHHHVALMPDAHVGYGMPIGGVLAAEGYIVPYAVGVDIGCGLIALETSLHRDEFLKQRENIGNQIFSDIPMGFEKYKKPQQHSLLKEIPDIPLLQKEATNIKRQRGTLGGGNHFVDVLYDETDRVWIMLHSGSRNIGLKIANFYHRLAVKSTVEEFGSNYPDKELSCLRADSPEGQEYLEAMNFAQDYALHNRKRMIEKVSDIFTKYLPKTEFGAEINIHHNYAALETHFGKKVWVHRKGATLAAKGVPGIIPGSMGTPSYITSGLGNPDSFNSAPHGAGRAMGRREAKRQFNPQMINEDLAKKDITLLASSNANALEEFTQAYKNVDDVIKLQEDLTEVVHKLLPMLVVIA